MAMVSSGKGPWGLKVLAPFNMGRCDVGKVHQMMNLKRGPLWILLDIAGQRTES
jgi:hypothetical protein